MKMREWEQVSQKATSRMEKQPIFSLPVLSQGDYNDKKHIEKLHSYFKRVFFLLGLFRFC